MNSRRKVGILTAAIGGLMAVGSLVVAPGAVSAGKPGGGSDIVAPTLGGDTITSHNTNGYSTGQCSSTEWHWVITGTNPSPADADVPQTITVTWSNSTSTVISLDKVTGGTAHYYYYGHLADGVTPTGASAVWPAATTATSVQPSST